MSATVATVLRSGGTYGPEYAERIADGLSRHLPGARLVCLTDTPDAVAHCCDPVPLAHDWPGWWAKIELFRPGLFTGPTLYLDLDTIIVGDLREIAAVAVVHPFTMLSDFFQPARPASGVMAWHGDWSSIYDAFAADPVGTMRGCRTPACWGDQGFIARHVTPARWQDLLPGQIQSRKVPGDRTAARLCCYHGSPKPHETGWRVWD